MYAGRHIAAKFRTVLTYVVMFGARGRADRTLTVGRGAARG